MISRALKSFLDCVSTHPFKVHLSHLIPWIQLSCPSRLTASYYQHFWDSASSCTSMLSWICWFCWEICEVMLISCDPPHMHLLQKGRKKKDKCWEVFNSTKRLPIWLTLLRSKGRKPLCRAVQREKEASGSCSNSPLPVIVTYTTDTAKFCKEIYLSLINPSVQTSCNSANCMQFYIAEH